MIDEEQGGFRGGKGCVDQIFTLKKIGEKAREKKCRVYVSFIDLGEAYDIVNREALRQVLKMYDENWNGEDGSEISGGGKKVEIEWANVYR